MLNLAQVIDLSRLWIHRRLSAIVVNQAAFIAGELASSAVASDVMRPLLAAASTVEPLVFELASALVAVCVAPAEYIEAQAVPQYSAALEATASLGQALRNCTNFATRLHALIRPPRIKREMFHSA